MQSKDTIQVLHPLNDCMCPHGSNKEASTSLVTRESWWETARMTVNGTDFYSPMSPTN